MRTPDGAELPLRLVVRPQARSIGLKVDPITREAIVVAPHERALPRALAFAQERAGWLAAQLAQLHPVVALAPDAKIPLLGEDTILVRAEGRGPARSEAGPPRRLVIPCPPAADFAARAIRALRAMAEAELCREVDAAAALLGAAPQQIRLKDTRSRWGSCTSTGVLTFSWRVIFAPPAVVRYLAAHEVAHLLEMNHSPAFWALVAKADPGYRSARAWLKRNGVTLHAIG